MPAPAPRSVDAAPGRPHGRLDEMKPRRLSPEEISAMRADYAGCITLIDDQIGEIIATVKARGEWDDTIVIFTSDHGEMNGDAGLIYKSNFLDGAVRVPLIISTPESRQSGEGRLSEALVEWIDLGPTIAEYAGVALDYPQFGKSLAPVVAEPGKHHRSEAISELSGEVMILNEAWKMAVNGDGEPYLLFHRKNDPGETRNLAGSPQTREVETTLRLRILERILQSQVREDGD